MDPLIFREIKVEGNNLYLIFHKDYPYNYNPEPFPVIKFSLINCQNTNNYNLSSIIDDCDGIWIDIQAENDHTKFIMTDASDIPIIIVCEKVIKEQIEYRNEDLIYLVKQLLMQRDEATDSNTKSLDLIFEVKYFLEKEIIIVERKISEAQRLPQEKKHFLEGQMNIMKKFLEILT